MAYRFPQRPTQPSQARTARLQAQQQQQQQQQKMLRVTGALVGLTLLAGGLVSLLQSLL